MASVSYRYDLIHKVKNYFIDLNWKSLQVSHWQAHDDLVNLGFLKLTS